MENAIVLKTGLLSEHDPPDQLKERASSRLVAKLSTAVPL
jgi:hypothetical protein